MAVRASDVAFLDLREDLMPRFAAREPRDLTAFGGGIAMIEIEEHRIAYATVGAWMVEQVAE